MACTKPFYLNTPLKYILIELFYKKSVKCIQKSFKRIYVLFVGINYYQLKILLDLNKRKFINQGKRINS